METEEAGLRVEGLAKPGLAYREPVRLPCCQRLGVGPRVPPDQRPISPLCEEVRASTVSHTGEPTVRVADPRSTFSAFGGAARGDQRVDPAT